MCKININQELNGIELSFEQKPERATLDAIKAQGFRWNGKKSIWYAKQTAERLTFAQTLGQVADDAPKMATYNLDDLGQNFCGHYGGAELSKSIREELKRRGVRGCSVRVANYDSIYVTVKATAEDFASIEEATERGAASEIIRALDHGIYKDGSYIYYNQYEAMTESERDDFIKWYIENSIKRYDEIYATNIHSGLDPAGCGWADHCLRRNYWELTTAGFEKMDAVIKIANQWNYNDSDPYSDYHDVGYYLTIYIKHPDGFTVREQMTDTERAAFEIEKEKAAQEYAAELARYEKKQAEERERAAKYEEWRKQATENIYNNVQVEDLPEQDQIYITDCVGGIGKECNIEELTETIEEHPHRADCLIDRLVTFTDRAALDDFKKLFLHDFIFLAGKGGSASEDVRLDDDTYNKLTSEQREEIKWYNNKCVGIVFNGEIELIIDPQGYDYARYVYMMSDNSEKLPAAQELTRQRKMSEGFTDFYIPAPISEQVANIEPGQEITIYQCDGWMLTNIIAGRGVVQDVRAGSWAQYNGYYIDFTSGKSVFIHDGRDCLIYEGLLTIPQEITREKVSDNMYKIYTVFDGLFDKVYTYFTGQGLKPVLDTIAK